MKPLRFVVDWDDTLVADHWPEQGPWLPGAVDALRELKGHGDVVIFSCRVSPYAFPSKPVWHEDVHRPLDEIDNEIRRMREMLDAVGMQDVEIWQRPYKPSATIYIDNRGLRFTGDWKDTLDDMYAVLDPRIGAQPMTFKRPGFSVADEERERAEERKAAEAQRVVDALADLPKELPPMKNLFQPKPGPWDCVCEPDMTCDRGCQVTEAHTVVHDPEGRFTFPTSADAIKALAKLGTEPWDILDRHPNSTRFHELLAEAGRLHDRKQEDYGKGDDPFANVRSSEEWGIDGWKGAMVRLNDKVKRLQTYARKGTLANEGVADSFMDIAVYALIAHVLWEQEQEQA